MDTTRAVRATIMAILGVVGSGMAAAAQTAAPADGARPAVAAVALEAPVELDGRLAEAVWRQAPAADGFLQREPEEGAPATQRTEVRFAYDDEALYVGARMYDDRGAEGVRTQLVRRDQLPVSDYLLLSFDTYHDRLRSSQFAVNPSGVRYDALSAAGTNADPSWDPVWEVATAIDSLGWTAELRIPFSQLRFSTTADQLWGLQIQRQVQRLNEQSVWSFWGLNETGGPSRYGTLDGLRVQARSRRLEARPYVVGQSSYRNGMDAADPFADPTAQQARVGADVKMLLTSNLTLDATVNPDFGQVEVDPAVVNLSAFETYFPERRPFFVEGAGMFSFGGMSCYFCSNVSSNSLFYSRRIGRAPQGGELADDAGDYARIPDNTTILGAAKLTGRAGGGWSVGALEAVTGRETGRVATDAGDRFDVPVEPLTNYFVGRVKRDLSDGNLQLGGMATSVYRSLPAGGLAELLPSHAEALGADAHYYWGDRTYEIRANLAVSSVTGDPAAIKDRQRSSARYFQRPDRTGAGNGVFSDAYDTLATSLRGYGGYVRVAKLSGDWRWETALNFRSPGYEVNDLAFQSRVDYVWMNANLLRNFTRPTRWYRSAWVLAGTQQQTNYDGDVTTRQFHSMASLQLPFYWSVSGFVIRRPSTFNDRLLRGGPVGRTPGMWYRSTRVSTDSRKPVVVSLNYDWSSLDDGGWGMSTGASIALKPASNLELSFGPGYARDRDMAQYVTSVDDATAADFFGRRYVFAALDRRTLYMDTRLNVIFTPAMSLELFAQPYLASGRYTAFEEFDRPRSLDRSVYGEDMGTIRAGGTGDDREYIVDPDGAGPAPTFSFDDPDFNFRSLRGSAVFRWEYSPGSTLYLVWTQQRSASAPYGDFAFARDRQALFAAQPDNIFMVKMDYLLGW